LMKMIASRLTIMMMQKSESDSTMFVLVKVESDEHTDRTNKDTQQAKA
jgi:hypothetical protein